MIRFAMTNYPAILRSLVIRCLCATPLWVVGWVIVTRADGGLAAAGPVLFAMLLFVGGAIIVARAIAALVAEPTGNLYMPAVHAEHPAPMYGIADARRAKGDYKGAMAYLDEIAAATPQEFAVYVKMIHIAAVDLHDLRRAEAAYQRGVKAMPTDGDKSALTVMYRALISRYKDPSQPEPVRAISFPEKRTKVKETLNV